MNNFLGYFLVLTSQEQSRLSNHWFMVVLIGCSILCSVMSAKSCDVFLCATGKSFRVNMNETIVIEIASCKYCWQFAPHMYTDEVQPVINKKQQKLVYQPFETLAHGHSSESSQ